jgi:CrcB protein
MIGYLAGLWSRGGQLSVHPNRWHFWVTGFCGGFTTFSTYVWQLLEMLRAGEGQAAGVYAAASVGFGLMAVWFGLSLSVAKLNENDQHTIE